MSQFERDLRESLRRREPPPGFAGKGDRPRSRDRPTPRGALVLEVVLAAGSRPRRSL